MLGISIETQNDRLSQASQDEFVTSQDPERFLNIEDIQFKKIIKLFEDLNLKQKKDFISKFLKA
jgi:hypothetical protein